MIQHIVSMGGYLTYLERELVEAIRFQVEVSQIMTLGD
jgi:hypothetical protein